jgi:hypothetical protein
LTQVYGEETASEKFAHDVGGNICWRIASQAALNNPSEADYARNDPRQPDEPHGEVGEAADGEIAPAMWRADKNGAPEFRIRVEDERSFIKRAGIARTTCRRP